MTQELLVEMARDALQYAYAPYSNYRVAAAILTEDGEVFTGVNVENAAYGATICAEQVAAVKAVSAGHRTFKALALTTGQGDLAAPCGICRQVLAEFASPDMIIILSRGDERKICRLDELLPLSFTRSNLLEGANNEL
ncbi:cytidine deaminase [bacterium]|nr:MAG: cytidine deaminase [bacterium]